MKQDVNTIYLRPSKFTLEFSPFETRFQSLISQTGLMLKIQDSSMTGRTYRTRIEDQAWIPCSYLRSC